MLPHGWWQCGAIARDTIMLHTRCRRRAPLQLHGVDVPRAQRLGYWRVPGTAVISAITVLSASSDNFTYALYSHFTYAFTHLSWYHGIVIWLV